MPFSPQSISKRYGLTERMKKTKHVKFFDIMCIWCGTVCSIGICGLLSAVLTELQDMALLVSSIGPSAVLLYAEANSASARPQNVIFGHVISALIGVAVYKLCGQIPWLSGALAVACAAVAMVVTNSFHPPGGGTALIAVIGDQRIHDLGFIFPFIPVGISAVIVVGVAYVVNKRIRRLQYSTTRR